MATARVERRLAAILAADVVGYSRLMERNEDRTLAWLKVLRTELVEPLIAEYQGRVVKLMGDGLLAEFASVVDAVHCAVLIQQAMAERERDLSEAERIRFRIGINLGDVIREADGDLYGDGVNIAARMESLAEPGGVIVSGTAYDHLQGKLDCGFEDLGEQRLKNIARPLRAFRVAPDGMAPGTGPVAAPPLPDRPSLAVLPFADMGADPAQGYFAEGITEELTTALARCRWLFVAARNSSFAYQGQAADVRRVGRELGVRYMLQGGVRRAGDRLRITGQLVEAESGAHVWADRYDGTLEDVFDLQDQVTASVVAAIEPALMSAEAERSRRLRPASLAAYDLFLRALSLSHTSGREGTAEAVRLLQLATTTADPSYAPSYALLAQCYGVRLGQGWCDDRRRRAAAGCVPGPCSGRARPRRPLGPLHGRLCAPQLLA